MRPIRSSTLCVRCLVATLLIANFSSIKNVDEHLGTLRWTETAASTSSHAKTVMANAGNAFFPVDSGQDGEYWPMVPDDHWNFMPRVFSPWNSTTTAHSWCGTAAYFDTRTPAGLIYSKVHKAASSTLAGVTIRVAKNYGRRRIGKACVAHMSHSDSRLFRKRDPRHSFMFSSIRHPAHRALSWIFYVGSNQGRTLNDEYILKQLRSKFYFALGYATNETADERYGGEAGAQVGYMHTGRLDKKPLWSKEEPTKVQDLRRATKRVVGVLKQYDLIMIVERLHESLVVLQLLLGLDTSDILYISAKRSGQYSYTTGRYQGCHLIAKSYISPAIAAYLSSPEWYAQNYEDFVLYKAANRSLDLTIESLGRERFEKALAKYKKMMEEAKICEGEAITPCTSDGVYVKETDCYEKDWGCGYPCLDRRFAMQRRPPTNDQ
ncbi:sulfotransferase family [Fragilaria crotonensis]|nr:sulfotransferase family [Fragilaria crotonensis]